MKKPSEIRTFSPDDPFLMDMYTRTLTASGFEVCVFEREVRASGLRTRVFVVVGSK